MIESARLVCFEPSGCWKTGQPHHLLSDEMPSYPLRYASRLSSGGLEQLRQSIALHPQSSLLLLEYSKSEPQLGHISWFISRTHPLHLGITPENIVLLTVAAFCNRIWNTKQEPSVSVYGREVAR